MMEILRRADCVTEARQLDFEVGLNPNGAQLLTENSRLEKLLHGRGQKRPPSNARLGPGCLPVSRTPQGYDNRMCCP